MEGVGMTSCAGCGHPIRPATWRTPTPEGEMHGGCWFGLVDPLSVDEEPWGPVEGSGIEGQAQLAVVFWFRAVVVTVIALVVVLLIRVIR
jgi:hypothetical protein